jgi:hypothetical protein
MLHRYRWLLRIGLTLILLPIIACALWVAIPMIFGFPIVVTLGPTTPSEQRYDCREFTDFLAVRNSGIFAAPIRDWWITDEYGRYQFPDRWLAPGEEVRVWSGSGTDNQANLYAGRRSPVWETSNFSYHVTYLGNGRESSSWVSCDNAPLW